MSSEPPAEIEPDVDALAAALRVDLAETADFAEALAAKLVEALPGAVQVERARSRPFGPRRLALIRVTLGADRLELRVRDGGLEATRARTSGGITLKTETLDVDAWLDALGAALAAHARQSAQTRQALERLLLG